MPLKIDKTMAALIEGAQHDLDELLGEVDAFVSHEVTKLDPITSFNLREHKKKVDELYYLQRRVLLAYHQLNYLPVAKVSKE